MKTINDNEVGIVLQSTGELNVWCQRKGPLDTSSENKTYSFDCQHKASISEEDGADWNTEVAAEHVHDVRFIVEARGQSVVVRSTWALQTLRNVPVWEQSWVAEEIIQ